MGIVEAVAHKLPDLVEVRLIRLERLLGGLARGFGAGRPCAERAHCRESENFPACRLHPSYKLRLGGSRTLARLVCSPLATVQSRLICGCLRRFGGLG